MNLDRHVSAHWRMFQQLVEGNSDSAAVTRAFYDEYSTVMDLPADFYIETVEGERDDVCAVGQTVAAHRLCRNLAAAKQTHRLQLGVGHYGVFNGRRWQNETYPTVRDFIRVN